MNDPTPSAGPLDPQAFAKDLKSLSPNPGKIDGLMPEHAGYADPSALSQPSLSLALTLAKDILDRRERVLTAKIKPSPRTAMWASSIPTCDRQGAYESLAWDKKKLHDARLQARFDAGNVLEKAMLDELRALGFEIVEQQAPLAADMTKRYGLVGRIDAKVRFGGRRIPLEIKSVNAWGFDRLGGEDGVISGVQVLKDDVFMVRYYRQCLAYLLGHNEPEMLVGFTNGLGAYKFLVVPLDYEDAELVLQKVERINKHVAAGTLPDRIPYDPDQCGRCPFAHECIPDILNDPKLRLMDRPDLEEKLKRREELEAAKREYDALDKAVKAEFKGVELAAVGDFVVTGKPVERKGYNVEAQTFWQTRIERAGEAEQDL